VIGNMPEPNSPSPAEPDEQWGLLRILDANGNRAGEGLRVVEEYVRFVLEDAHLTRLCKQLRHDLQTQLAEIDPHPLAARDTTGDVGTSIATDQESQRADARSIAAASFKRVEQALRCLEEYSKPFDRHVAAAFEQLRYRTYTLGRAVLTTIEATERLRPARLYLLVDASRSEDAFESRMRELASHVDVIQLREKQLDDRWMLERARIARSITRDHGTLLIVNDRPDLARLCDADGVHLGQDDLSVRDARLVLGPGRLIGVSTHDITQARQAVLEGADYIGCGPTFPSQTKDFCEFPGLDFLRAASDEIRLPSFAIGGITPDNLPMVTGCGFQRVAVSGCVTRAEDPTAVLRQLRRILEGRTLEG
jgi:thiamine-phosphate pyrophosphorylase